MPSEQSLAGLEVVELGPCIAVPFSAELHAEGGARALANPVRLARFSASAIDAFVARSVTRDSIEKK